MLPSDFFRRNVVLSFQEDAIGIRLRDAISVDNTRERGRSRANGEKRERHAPRKNGSLKRFANAIRATAEIAPQAQS